MVKIRKYSTMALLLTLASSDVEMQDNAVPGILLLIPYKYVDMILEIQVVRVVENSVQRLT
jgi:hypothetical protein